MLRASSCWKPTLLTTVAVGLILADAAAQTQASGRRPSTAETQVELTEGTNMAIALRPGSGDLALDLVGRIWLLAEDEEVARSLTIPEADARQPAWSPDGARIVFQSYLDGNWHLWTVGTDGDAPTRLTSGPFDDREPHWSPAGDRIVFASDRGGSYDIWELELARLTLRRLTSAPSAETNPAVSPDGTTVAYIAREGADSHVVLMDRSGDSRRVHTGRGRLVAPSWSPDGRTLSVVDPSLGASAVLLIDTETEGSASRRLSTDGEDVFPFRAAWQGSAQLLYTADGGIQRRGVDGSDLGRRDFSATVTLQRPQWTRRARDFDATAPRKAVGIGGPQVSPDGRSVAFAALGDLWIHDEAGGNRRLTDDPFLEADPAWSPDGRYLAYSTDRAGTMDIWVRDMSDGSERQLTSGGNAEMSTAWSPDGTRLAYIRRAGLLGPLAVAVIDARGGDPTLVADGSSLFAAGRPAWSPDGRQLAVVVLKPFSGSYREGVSVVRLFPVDGGEPHDIGPPSTISLGPRGTAGPVFSPDGGLLAYSAGSVLWTVPVARDGTPIGDPMRVTDELAESPSWTGDSQSIAYLSVDRVRQISLSDSRVVTLMEGPEYRRAEAPARTVIHAGAIWDGRADTARNDVDIVVEGRRIQSVQPHDASLHRGEVVDASSGFVIPGLVESHGHQGESLGEGLGRLLLSYGITSIREPATDPYEAINRREATQAGVRVGPRVFTTGYMLDGSRIYYDLGQAIEPGPQLDRELDRADRLDYDLVKTYVRLSDPMQKRTIERAHELGLWVTSHEVYPSVANGGDGVEHIQGTSRRGYSPKVTRGAMRTYQDIVDMLASSGMVITPTISLQGGFSMLTSLDPDRLDDPRMRILNPNQTAGAAQDVSATAALRVRNQQRFITELVRKGGRVVAGTDSPIVPFGISLHAELELFVDGGLTPVEALRTATTWAADVLGAPDDLGAIVPGMLADMVILDADPLVDIENTRRVRAVMVDGRLHTVVNLVRGPDRRAGG